MYDICKQDGPTKAQAKAQTPARVPLARRNLIGSTNFKAPPAMSGGALLRLNVTLLESCQFRVERLQATGDDRICLEMTAASASICASLLQGLLDPG